MFIYLCDQLWYIQLNTNNSGTNPQKPKSLFLFHLFLSHRRRKREIETLNIVPCKLRYLQFCRNSYLLASLPSLFHCLLPLASNTSNTFRPPRFVFFPLPLYLSLLSSSSFSYTYIYTHSPVHIYVQFSLQVSLYFHFFSLITQKHD